MDSSNIKASQGILVSVFLGSLVWMLVIAAFS
jgi:hypothetical protein